MPGLFLILSCLMANAADMAPRAAEATAYLERFDQAQKPITAAKGDFEQAKTLSLFSSKLVSKGRFALQKPNKLLWEYLPPDQSVIKTNGNKLWFYLPENGKGETYNIAQRPQIRFVLKHLVPGFGAPITESVKYFSVSVLDAADEEDVRLRMTPLPKTGPDWIHELVVRLNVKNGTPKGFVLTDEAKDVTDVTFSTMELNPSFSSDVFAFKKPR